MRRGLVGCNQRVARCTRVRGLGPRQLAAVAAVEERSQGLQQRHQ